MNKLIIICVHIYIYIYIYTHAYVYIYIYIGGPSRGSWARRHWCESACSWGRTWSGVCVYVYIYIYIYIHTHTEYIYIYIYIVCTPNLPAKTLLHDWPRSNRACVRQAINVRQFIHSFKAPLTRDAGQWREHVAPITHACQACVGQGHVPCQRHAPCKCMRHARCVLKREGWAGRSFRYAMD